MDWTYKPGANGSATSLLSTYANGSDAKYNYDYDANGNITKIWRGNTSFTNASEKYSYVYDSANQLVRENLYYGSGNSSNATITYEYDIWGNLLNKKIYAYTVGTLGTARETVPYAYTNSAWKDQLTSYDGESITYDASGNPTNYLGATLVWEGQRLKSYTPKDASSGRANSYVYSYDENGIRTRKTIGSTVTDYYYNGTLLMGTVKTTTHSDGSTTTSKLRFSYDANGKVVAVNYNGNYYYYLRNAQSDIVKLIDKTGATVVEYRYDSWGKLLSTSGSLASTLGKNNPFRYRGYVYDEETGFYYLQSRYYNPEVGRFISSDVLLSTGQGVLGHNAYAYCLNNPVNMSDSCGLYAEAIKPLDKAGGGSVDIVTAIGSIIATITVAITKAASSDAETDAKPNTDSRTRPKPPKGDEEEPAVYTVYGLIDSKDTVQYVGRTKNIAARKKAHENSNARGHLTMHIFRDGLTYDQARGLEQLLMVYYHTLNALNPANNQINGIRMNNPKYRHYIDSANALFENIISNEVLNILGY
ncbi:MAG: RHS repeat-associated core domain-containing protein [Christensenellales bacterium]